MEEIINKSSKCPVKSVGHWEYYSWGKEYETSGETTDEHFFVQDREPCGFMSHRLLGFHCSKCGLTIRYK